MALNAATAVFGIPELIGAIFMRGELTTTDVVRALRISRRINKAIWGSMKLRRKLWLDPAPGRSVTRFTDCDVTVNEILGTIDCEYDCFPTVSLLEFNFNIQSLANNLQCSPDSPWKEMFVTQPPALELDLYYSIEVCCVYTAERRKDGVIRVPGKYETSLRDNIKRSKGVRVQDVVKAVQGRAAEQESACRGEDAVASVVDGVVNVDVESVAVSDGSVVVR